MKLLAIALTALWFYRCPVPVEQTYPDGCSTGQSVPCHPGDNG